MTDKTHQARVAALSMAQCGTMVNLLRAHGQSEHAQSVETAIGVVATILSNELGKDTLAEAMNWVSDELGETADFRGFPTTPH